MTADGAAPLTGVRVIDMADEKGELCGRILADLGADVVRIEPPGGAVSRGVPPFAPGGESLYFAVRNTNKRGMVVDLERQEERERLERMLASADVWIESTRPGMLNSVGLEPREVSERLPRLVVTSITDFGQTGPYRDYAATDAVMVAISGMLFRSGVPDRPPLLPPGALAYDVAGVVAAFATLAAYWQRLSTGAGQHLDLSVVEAVAQIADWALPNYSASSASGQVYGELRNGSGPVYPLYPCADGYVRLIVLSPRQWRALREWLGEPESLQDDRLDSFLARLAIQTEVLDPLYRDFFADKRMADLAAESQRRGIVMTPVLGPADVLATPHYGERKTFVEGLAAARVEGPVASGFFEIDGRRAGYRHRAPVAGEHDGEEMALPAPPHDEPAPARRARMPRHPFTGLRVLDFGIGGVGVEAGRLFAEYGADVIKIETRTYPDFMRTVAGSEMSPSFASSNRSKRSFGVNLRHEEGRELVKRLATVSDAVIENSATGTMADMGLPYDALREVNPRLVMVSSQLMGSTGPWKDWIGYGPSTRPIGGMTWLWNFPEGGMPPGSGAIYPDHLVGRVCATGAVAALVGRSRSGTGAHVEVAQVETVINLLADLFLREALVPGSVRPLGNTSERGAPWGVYPCAGDQRWCVITVRDDEDWRRLRRVMGEPPWAKPEWDAAEARLRDRATIDEAVGAWTSTLVDREVMERCQAERVPAAMMSYASDLARDPHLDGRGFLLRLDQPGVGEMVVEGPAFHGSGMPGPVTRPAPGLGEHTREICTDLLGLDDGEVDELVSAGVLEEAH